MNANDIGRFDDADDARPDLYPSRQADRPQILDRREATVHGKWTPAAPLSRKQAEAFERDGFIVLCDLFDAAEIEALCAEASRIRTARVGELDPATVIAEPDSGAVRSVFRVHVQSSIFGRLASDARLARIAQFVLDDEVYIHQSRMNYKPGFQGKEFYWHSDFETWHVEDGMPRMRALSMTVLLTENTPHNGPLMLIPGSHRSYVGCVGETPEDHYKHSLRRQEYGVPDDESLTMLAERGGIQAPVGPAGTVILFDCNTMHGSSSNITPFPRSNAFIVFNAMSNRLERPFGPSKPRPEHIATRESFDPVEPQSGLLVRNAA
ncbi:MAG TPA: ectoine hydroxylase [Woeseiaceae bacterium]|nr:ectoine hydroxylase [Woeseiaceae bacterium]